MLTEEDIAKLVRPNPSAPTFVRDTYKGLFFNERDCEFLDNLWANVQELGAPLKVFDGARCCRARVHEEAATRDVHLHWAQGLG